MWDTFIAVKGKIIEKIKICAKNVDNLACQLTGVSANQMAASSVFTLAIQSAVEKKMQNKKSGGQWENKMLGGG